MFILGLWKIVGNDGRSLTGVESDFHNAGGRMWAVSRHPEGADVRRLSHEFSVRNPTAVSRMGEVGG